MFAIKKLFAGTIWKLWFCNLEHVSLHSGGEGVPPLPHWIPGGRVWRNSWTFSGIFFHGSMGWVRAHGQDACKTCVEASLGFGLVSFLRVMYVFQLYFRSIHEMWLFYWTGNQMSFVTDMCNCVDDGIQSALRSNWSDWCWLGQKWYLIGLWLDWLDFHQQKCTQVFTLIFCVSISPKVVYDTNIYSIPDEGK